MLQTAESWKTRSLSVVHSWQVEGDGVLVSPRYLELHRELWARQQAALRRAQPEVVQQAAAAKQVGCSASLLPLLSHPCNHCRTLPASGIARQGPSLLHSSCACTDCRLRLGDES
jgi:hypothetical protein